MPCPVCGKENCTPDKPSGVTFIEPMGVPAMKNTSGKDLFLDASRTKVVAGDDPSASMLLMRKDGEMDDADVAVYGKNILNQAQSFVKNEKPKGGEEKPEEVKADDGEKGEEKPEEDKAVDKPEENKAVEKPPENKSKK